MRLADNTWHHALGAKLDYTWPWGEKWLRDGETLSTYTFTAPQGVTLSGIVRDPADEKVTVWVDTGTVRGTVTVVGNIVTSEGRKDSRTLTLLVGRR